MRKCAFPTAQGTLVLLTSTLSALHFPTHVFSGESKDRRRAPREQTPSQDDLIGMFPHEEVDMEEQKQQTRKTSDRIAGKELCAKALCDKGEGEGSFTPSAALERLGATSAISVVDEDDDEDLQLALALSASLAESKTNNISAASNSDESRESSERLQLSSQSSGKGEDSQKQVLLRGVSHRSNSSNCFDTHVRPECNREGSTSAAIQDVASIRESRTRPKKSDRRGSITNEQLRKKPKERRLSAKCDQGSTSSPGGAESSLLGVESLIPDGSRGDLHDSSDSSDSHVRGTSSLPAQSSSLARSRSNAPYERAVSTCGLTPHFSEKAAVFGEIRPEEHDSLYRLPCSANSAEAPKWLFSSNIQRSNADDVDTICRNAFGERRRERRERRRGKSSLEDEADVLEKEEDGVEPVFSEGQPKGGSLGSKCVTGMRITPKAQHTDPGREYSIHDALPTTACNSGHYPKADAAVSKRDRAGSDSIVNTSSSSSVTPRSNTCSKAESRRSSSSTFCSSTENSTCGPERSRVYGGGGNVSSHHIAAQNSSVPSSAGATSTEKRCKMVAEEESGKQPRGKRESFLQLQQQQPPQHQHHLHDIRETGALPERKLGETISNEYGSSRTKRLFGVMAQHQHSGQHHEGTSDFGDQHGGAQQKPVLSATPLANNPPTGAEKSQTVDEGVPAQTKATERRHHHCREVNSEGRGRRKTADRAIAKGRRKRRKTSSDENTEDGDEDEEPLKYEDDSTLSDETETVFPGDDEDDDEETQLQVALAVSLSTVEQERGNSNQTSAMITAASSRGSSCNSSTKIAEFDVAYDNSNKHRKTGTRSSGSNKGCTSGTTNGSGAAHTISERRKKKTTNSSANARIYLSSSTDAQPLPDQYSHCGSRDVEQDDCCVRKQTSPSDYGESSGCEHNHPGVEKTCREKNGENDRNADKFPQDAEVASCSFENDIVRGPLMETAVSLIGCGANVRGTPAGTMSATHEEHGVSLHVAGSEATLQLVCDTMRKPVSAVAAISPLEDSSLLQLYTQGAQTAGGAAAAQPSTASVSEVTDAGQTREISAGGAGAARAGISTAETAAGGMSTTAVTMSAKTPSLVAKGVIPAENIGRIIARTRTNVTIMQCEDVGCSTGSEEDQVEDEKGPHSDFEPERRGFGDRKGKKERVEELMQGRGGREAQHEFAKGSPRDSEDTTDNSINETTSSAGEERNHDDVEASDEDGTAMTQTHPKVKRERQVRQRRQQQHLSRLSPQAHHQQRRRPQRNCKSSEDHKDERRQKRARRSEIQSTLSAEMREEGKGGTEGQQGTVKCQKDVGNAETAAALRNLGDSKTPDSAETNSDVSNAHVVMPQLTPELANVSPPSSSANEESTVGARVNGRAITVASRIGDGAPAASLQGDGVHVKAVRGRQRGNCIAGGVSVKMEQEKKWRKTRGPPRQQWQNEKQELRSVSNAAAAAAVKMWKHERLHEVCLYVWAALTEAISLPCRGEAAPHSNTRRPGGTDRLIRAIDDQHRRQEQREQEQLEQILREQQQSHVGNRLERKAATDNKGYEEATSDSPAGRHPLQQHDVSACAKAISKRNEIDILHQHPLQQELSGREQHNPQLCTAEQGRGKQQMQHLPPPRPFLTLEQLSKVAEKLGLAGLTVDELIKMVATAAGAAEAAGERQQQHRKCGAGQLPEKKGRNRKQGGYLSSDACGQYYSQALGRTTLSFEEFVAFFHYGLGLRVESNGKVW